MRKPQLWIVALGILLLFFYIQFPFNSRTSGRGFENLEDHASEAPDEVTAAGCNRPTPPSVLVGVSPTGERQLPTPSAITYPMGRAQR